MPDLPVLLLLGAVCGLIASFVMDLFQRLAAMPLGQTGGGEPTTVKFADKLSVWLTANPVTQKRRAMAGMLVHYAAGLVLGMIYVVVAADWPTMQAWFGVAYGLIVAVALDYVAVPALGLGAPAWKTPLNTHVYGLLSHAVFGASLQAAREIGFLLF